LVRGLDYYTRTVFEWTTDQLGSQSTVCGGGRYDGLVILAKNLRDTFPQLEVYSDFSGSKLKKQHQRALKESADIVVTLNVDHTLGIWSISDNDKLVINKEEFLDHIQIFIKE